MQEKQTFVQKMERSGGHKQYVTVGSLIHPSTNEFNKPIIFSELNIIYIGIN